MNSFGLLFLLLIISVFVIRRRRNRELQDAKRAILEIDEKDVVSRARHPVEYAEALHLESELQK